MVNNTTKNNTLKTRKIKFKRTIALLVMLGAIAVAFTLLIIHVQAGTASYLAGLNSWTRGQSEAIRQSHLYIRTGDDSALASARFWYQVPLGDLTARLHLERETLDYDAAYQGLLKGENHPQ